MAKTGFILDNSFNVLMVYKQNKPLSKDINDIFDYDLSREENFNPKKMLYSEITKAKLKNKIQDYLSIRNHDEPDYGIIWQNTFKREQVFTKVTVLNKEIELYSGNEDAKIHFLANVDNSYMQEGKLIFFGAPNKGV